MTIKAKQVLKDKFWIVEDNGERVGTLCWDEDRYMFTSHNETCFFEDEKQMENKFGIEMLWDEPKKETSYSYEVHNFPTSVQPFNALYDVKRKLPLFTKSEKSKSLYCAGYYIIRFDKGWVKSFCPKLLTVERYETQGPFKTDIEMRQELSRANR